MGRETPREGTAGQSSEGTAGGSGAAVGIGVGLPGQEPLMAPGTWCGAGAVAALESCVGAVDAARQAELSLLDGVARLYSEMEAFLTTQSDLEGGGSWRGADLAAEVVDEFVVATGESRGRTHQIVALVTAHPDVLTCGREAISEGRAGLWRVLDWHSSTNHLPVEVMVAIGQEVFTRAADASPRSAASFRRLLARRVRQADAADTAAARAKRDEALSQRGSWASQSVLNDGTGCLSVTGEVTRVAAAWARLDAAARRAKAAGDSRTLGQLRSDLHLDLVLIGQLPGATGRNAGGQAGMTMPDGGPGGGEPVEAAHTVFTRPTQPPLPTGEPAETGHAVPPGADPAPAAPPVCTSCGVVSRDWFPLPTIGDPVLPPAKCTIVVGLDVLIDNGANAKADGDSSPPGGSGPPGASTRPGQTGDPTTTDQPTTTPDATAPYPGTPGNGPRDGGDGEPGGAGAGVAGVGGGDGLWGAPVGWIPDFGYLDPEHVRAVAVREGSVWQRLVADPVSGHAVAVSPHTYRPTASVARFVRARDGIARDPGSGTSASACEIDHVIPFNAGGTTTLDNLQCLSTRGHTRKTKRGWTAEAHPDGTIEWNTRLGQTTTTGPHDYRTT